MRNSEISPDFDYLGQSSVPSTILAKGRVLWAHKAGEVVETKNPNDFADISFCSSLEEARFKLANELFHAVVLDPVDEFMLLLDAAQERCLPVVGIVKSLNPVVMKQAVNRGVLFLLERPLQTADLYLSLQKCWREVRGVSGLTEFFFLQKGLTKTETEVARLAVKGLSIEDMARSKGISSKTVKAHLTNIFQKCGVKSRTSLLSSIVPSAGQGLVNLSPQT